MVKNIKNALYETYKMKWVKEHISTEEIIKTIEAFHESPYTNLDDYVNDNGYIGGQLYASFEEFLKNEYLDTDYMLSLIKDDMIRKIYLEDVNKTKRPTYSKCDELLEMLTHYQKEKEKEALTKRYEEELLKLKNSVEIKKLFEIIEYSMNYKILFHEIIKYLLRDDIYAIVADK